MYFLFFYGLVAYSGVLLGAMETEISVTLWAYVAWETLNNFFTSSFWKLKAETTASAYCTYRYLC